MDRHIRKVPFTLSKSVLNYRVEAIAEGRDFVNVRLVLATSFIEGTLELGNIGRYRVGALLESV